MIIWFEVFRCDQSFKVPGVSVVITGVMMAVVILTVSEEDCRCQCFSINVVNVFKHGRYCHAGKSD